MDISKEFYISDDGVRIHMKLDLPESIFTEITAADSASLCPDSLPERLSAGGHPAVAGRSRKIPLMVLIHGFTGNMEERHILAVKQAANDAGCAVLRAEMYGHGLSSGEFCDHTLFKWMSNAMAVIDYARALDFVSDLYLCGHSQGGLLTMLVGAMERDRIRALLELSPASMIPEMARRGELLGVSFDPENPPRELDTGKSLFIGENYIRAAQMIDVDLAVSRYTGPVLIVHGTGDGSVPFHYSEKLVKKYVNARLVPIQGDTHCYDYHLEQAADAVRKFLKDVSRNNIN